jgi:LacI family transcriptional regulator
MLPEQISTLFLHMGQKKRAVTIQDVAKEAGVSVSTVSRVLNGKDDVALETIEKVQGVVRDLSYTSSLAARGMRSRRTNVIGLIMPDVSSPYCVEVMRGVNRTIAQSDYDLIVYTTGDIRKYGTAEGERHYVTLLNGNIADGVIVVTPAATEFSTNAPIVAIDPNNESPECPGIIANNQEGALQAMSYLAGLGHRRIGFITGRLDLVSACQRLQGYKDGLAAAGIPFQAELVQTGDYTTEAAICSTRALLALQDPPTAIFASNDMSAAGVYQAAKAENIYIPDDLSVIGFDNLPESGNLNPPLTTIDQFVSEMGNIATQMVIKLVNGEALPVNFPGSLDLIREYNLYKIPTRLVIRDLCSSM